MVRASGRCGEVHGAGRRPRKRFSPARRGCIIFCSATCDVDANRHVLDAVDEVRPETGDRAGHVEVAQAQEQLLEHHADLEASEMCADAHMRAAAAERHVRVGIAAHVEAEGLGEDLLVEVPGDEPHDDLVALADPGPS